MARPPRQLDSRIEIVTPENIAFHYLLAGPFRRLPAYLIDCGVCVLFLLATFIVASLWSLLGGLAGLSFGVWLIVAFVVSWFYFGLFETFWNGQTPGKRLIGLRVLSVDGQPINAMQAVMRNVLRSVDALPFWGLSAELSIPFYMVALVSMALTDRYQRLGDLTCGTMVVVERRSALRGVAALEHEEVVRFALGLPVHFAASRAMGHALSVYVARRELFSPARRFEIARTLAEPLAERLGLPADTNPDLLLCAMYYRTFIADRSGGGRPLTAEAEAAQLEAAEVVIR
jgi:uncharacterized RDD family membrane protein YckC